MLALNKMTSLLSHETFAEVVGAGEVIWLVVALNRERTVL